MMVWMLRTFLTRWEVSYRSKGSDFGELGCVFTGVQWEGPCQWQPCSRGERGPCSWTCLSAYGLCLHTSGSLPSSEFHYHHSPPRVPSTRWRHAEQLAGKHKNLHLLSDFPVYERWCLTLLLAMQKSVSTVTHCVLFISSCLCDQMIP